MGIYDRDYYRNPPSHGGFGHFVAWSVTTWLIVINVAVFFVDAVIPAPEPPPQIVSIDGVTYAFHPARSDDGGMLTALGHFSIDKGIAHLQVWRLISYQFLHHGPWHLIMNMIGVYFFGPIIEAHFGSRRYLAFYLLCGIAGAAFVSVLAAMHMLSVTAATQLVGASGSIFGLLVAAAMIAPNVQLIYYFIPITIRTAAIIAMGLAFYTVLHSGHQAGQNAGGEAAHLGGGVLGFLLIKNQHWLHVFEPARASSGHGRAPARRGRRKQMFQKDWSKDMNR